MKKITIINSNLNYGGIEQYLSSLCDMLSNKYEIELYVVYKCDDKIPFKFNSVKIKYVYDYIAYPKKCINYIKQFNLIKAFKEGITGLKIIFSYNSKMKELARSIKSDYIITTRPKESKFINKYSKRDIYKIYTEHSFPSNKEIKKIIQYTSNFNKIIPVNESIKDIYELYVADKTMVIPNVLDYIPSVRSSISNHNLISVGRFDKVKAFDELIDVVRIVKESINDIKLYLIGDGKEMDNIKLLINKYNLNNNIMLTGYLKRCEIEKYMLDSTIYVMTSIKESFGLALLEAMSYGIPCIAFKNSGSESLLKGDGGILINNRDHDIMAGQIINLLNDKDSLLMYSDRGLEKIKEYDKKEIRNMWLKLLK